MLPEWSSVFFAALTRSPNVSAAAAEAGVTRTYVYRVRAEDPEFAAAWEDAVQTGIEILEGRVWERACEESDTLAIFLLKSHKPAVYREQVDVTHSGTVNLQWPDVNINEASESEDAPPAPGATGGKALACQIQSVSMRTQVG